MAMARREEAFDSAHDPQLQNPWCFTQGSVHSLAKARRPVQNSRACSRQTRWDVDTILAVASRRQYAQHFMSHRIAG